jgi:hypothetical protein
MQGVAVLDGQLLDAELLVRHLSAVSVYAFSPIIAGRPTVPGAVVSVTDPRRTRL